MSLTTKPPGGGSPLRPDAAPPGPARPDPGRAPALDELAALRLLIEEVVAGSATLPGLSNLPPPPVLRDPRASATALLAWLARADEAAAPPPERIALLVERAYARVLEVLARLPAGSDPAKNAVTLARTLLLAGLKPTPDTPPPLRSPGAMPLKVLVEEFERAIAAELGTQAPAPRIASGEEPGNVAAALLRWLRAVAVAANVTPARLRGLAERTLEATQAALSEAAAPPEALAELDKARDVLLAALPKERPEAATPQVPTFRPDLPVTVSAGRRRRDSNVPAEGRKEGDAAGEEPAQEEDEAPAAPEPFDTQGPMELIRRYFEDFLSPTPGECARHFVYPACRWQRGEWLCYADAETLRRTYEARQRELRARGVASGRILMLRVEPLGAGIATVRALLGRDGPPGRPAEEVEVAYTTVLTPEGWRIAVLVLP